MIVQAAHARRRRQQQQQQRSQMGFEAVRPQGTAATEDGDATLASTHAKSKNLQRRMQMLSLTAVVAACKCTLTSPPSGCKHTHTDTGRGCGVHVPGTTTPSRFPDPPNPSAAGRASCKAHSTHPKPRNAAAHLAARRVLSFRRPQYTTLHPLHGPGPPPSARSQCCGPPAIRGQIVRPGPLRLGPERERTSTRTSTKTPASDVARVDNPPPPTLEDLPVVLHTGASSDRARPLSVHVTLRELCISTGAE
jgi:hypothetical protein